MYAILSDIVLTKQNNYFISLQLKLNVMFVKENLNVVCNVVQVS